MESVGGVYGEDSPQPSSTPLPSFGGDGDVSPSRSRRSSPTAVAEHKRNPDDIAVVDDTLERGESYEMTSHLRLENQKRNGEEEATRPTTLRARSSFRERQPSVHT